jgi:large subunit ribosomal protein L4
MAELEVKNWKNEVVEKIELKDDIFSKPMNKHLLWHYVRVYLAHQRQGNASTKTRAEVSGSGRKLWRQKGTGRARIGSIRSPLWRHGGTVHGPKPRKYDLKINKKEKQEALKIALSQKLKENSLIVLDSLKLEKPKTKELVEKLNNFNLKKSVLLVDFSNNKELKLASRNLQKINCVFLDSLSAYDVLKHKNLFISKEAVNKLQEAI